MSIGTTPGGHGFVQGATNMGQFVAAGQAVAHTNDLAVEIRVATAAEDARIRAQGYADTLAFGTQVEVTDAFMGGRVDDPASATRAALAAFTSTLHAAGGDETARINAFLADAAPGAKRLVGSFTISAPLVVPAGRQVDLTAAQITQTASNQHVFNVGNDCTLTGGRLVGRGVDFTPGGGVTAAGVNISGRTGVRVCGLHLSNFAGAAVRVFDSTDVELSDLTIVGLGAPTITAGLGSPGFGITIDGTSSRVAVARSVISGCSQGIIGGINATRVTITAVRVRDIPGQHGVYLQNGTGVVINGLDLANIHLNGCKLQLAATSAADSTGTSITAVSASATGDSALSLNNTATDLSGARKFRGVTIANLTATGCFRALYLGSVRGAVASAVSATGSTSDALTLLDCQDVILSDVAVVDAGRVGLRITTATGASTSRVTCSGVRIHNAGNRGEASHVFGVYHAAGANVTFEGLTVTATNGLMQYGYFIASATAADQETLTMRGVNLSGDTGTSARFRNPQTTVTEWSNVRTSGSILFKPTGQVAASTLP